MRRRLIAIVFVVGCATAHDPTRGAWQSAGGGYLSVEPSRLVWFDPEHNDLSVSTILQRDQELVTRYRGRFTADAVDYNDAVPRTQYPGRSTPDAVGAATRGVRGAA